MVSKMSSNNIFATIIILVLFLYLPCNAQLSSTFYDRICPDALPIIRSIVRDAVSVEPRMAASLIRLHFHDCFVQGCDASILLDDAPGIQSEKSANPNINSVRGFNVIEDIKAVVEDFCFRIVSCADILTVAARDASVAVGGPTWTVKLGRRDSTTANRAVANSDLPSPFSNLNSLISSFANKGLNAREMVVLSGKSHVCDTVGRSFLERFGVEGVSLPCPMITKRFIHSGEPKEYEAGTNPPPRNMEFPPRNMEFNRGFWDRRGTNFVDGFQMPQYNVEQNADVVHIKMLRNNTFITVTDSKGNKKFGISAGKLAVKGAKTSRYSGEESAEQIGRIIRDRGIKSVVVKVNGFTYFKKKKQAILGLKEGYSHHRGDKHPIVYIEDTTQKAHNGCRLRKQRRV